MAYFRRNEQDSPPRERDEEALYDDGFDALEEETEEPVTPEEADEEMEHRFRLAYGAGNLAALVAGVVVILLLITLLLSMIRFVQTDMSRNLALFETRF